MSSLRQSILLVSFYLASVFVLAQFDYSDAPIIDFAKYFYFAVMIAIPSTVFFPRISRVHVAIPVVFWGGIYFAMLQLMDRTASAPNTTFPIILLEFVLLLVGVWLSYQLADGISHAESILDAMALSAFPNRVHDIREASRQIKLEITRSRRYSRPLTLIVFKPEFPVETSGNRFVYTVQHDLSDRFSLARVGQSIDSHLRQTDMVFRDELHRFIVLCPESNFENSEMLSKRIAAIVHEKTGVQIMIGVAAFPDDALNFDDLLDVGISRLAYLDKKEEQTILKSTIPSA